MHEALARLFRIQRVTGAYRRKFADLSDEDTKLVLTDFARACNRDRSTAQVGPGGAIDPVALAFEEGKRTAFLYLLRRINADPSAVDEAIQKEISHAA